MNLQDALCRFISTQLSRVEPFLEDLQEKMVAKPRLCSAYTPPLYLQAEREHPRSRYALQAVASQPIATWYTDRVDDPGAVASAVLDACCKANDVPVFVVYGLPHKDCDAGLSSAGSNQNDDDYADFVSRLASLVSTRQVIYVIEPDALALLAQDAASCAWTFNYFANLVRAVELLTCSNPNARVYIDVGHWVLSNVSMVLPLVANLTKRGRGHVMGIAINTSNFRTTSELTQLCHAFVDAGTAQYGYNWTCVFDTARNYRGPAPDGEWCNPSTAAIGVPPTDQTGIRAVDYFLWLKPPGESDGECADENAFSLPRSPDAGQYFDLAFSLMFDQGYLTDRGSKSTKSTSVTAGLRGKYAKINKYTMPPTPPPSLSSSPLFPPRTSLYASLVPPVIVLPNTPPNGWGYSTTTAPPAALPRDTSSILSMAVAGSIMFLSSTILFVGCLFRQRAQRTRPTTRRLDHKAEYAAVAQVETQVWREPKGDSGVDDVDWPAGIPLPTVS
ncbi:hypothetical protein AC1031_016701 [Aphanomyces cochlioides]|nr:hypothetical protein AC1031_016701 [Aphanomyces cochlioides]